MLAWWGSFRIGEILPKLSHQFDAKSNLLARDLTFNDDSVAVWIRSPKVWTSDTGVIVEVWRVESRPDLDPVVALLTFMQLREKVFGKAEDLPVFLLESGAIYSHSDLNRDLTELPALYPALNTSRDKWQGHSFRSGISTLLSVLGYKKVCGLSVSDPGLIPFISGRNSVLGEMGIKCLSLLYKGSICKEKSLCPFNNII